LAGTPDHFENIAHDEWRRSLLRLIEPHSFGFNTQITPLPPTAYFDSGTFGGVVSLLTVLRISCACAIAIF
jgi:hypothetical protein